MKINIKATSIDLTDAIGNYVYKRLGALEKYLPKNPDLVAKVEVGKITEHHKSGEIYRAEIHIVGGGLDYYAATEETDLYQAIDKVKDEISQEIRRKKGKNSAVRRKGEQMIKAISRGYTWGKGKISGFKRKDEK